MAKRYIYILSSDIENSKTKIHIVSNTEAAIEGIKSEYYTIYATYETNSNFGHDRLCELMKDIGVIYDGELWAISPEDLYKIIKCIAIFSGTLGKLKKGEPIEKKYERKPRREGLSFWKCHIPEGAELVYTGDDTIRVKVVSEKKVLYGDEVTSLSTLAKKLRGYTVRGTEFFTYNGKLLSTIAEETQWKEDNLN